MRAAFIGLGVMGFPMAGHLLRRGGMSVTVYNRTRAKADAWCAEYGGTAADSPAAAAAGAEVVVLCVGDDPDVRAVTLGATGVLSGMVAGSLLIDHTTASADVARELATACSARGIGFLDAPVPAARQGLSTVR